MAKSILVSILAAAVAVIVAPASAEEPADTPREVKIHLLLADLTDVSGADQVFSADVFMKATWQDPDLAGGTEPIRSFDLSDVWRPTLLIVNSRAVKESMPQEVMVRPDGTVTYLQRYTGQFSVPMNLREFPKDRQKFFIWVVAATDFGASVTLVPDESEMTLRSKELSISDWDIGEASLFAEAFQTAPGTPRIPGIKLAVPGSRCVTYYTIQVLIPLMAIVMMAYAVFWISPTVVPTRVGVVVTTMLTLIAYRFMLANHVPRLSYLTRLDWFMLGATVLVILTLFTMAGTSYLVSREHEALVKKIDRAGRLLYPGLFALFTLILWLR
jgi:hypothetical protein